MRLYRTIIYYRQLIFKIFFKISIYIRWFKTFYFLSTIT
nr:MAG TPA: hypothetical protein [Caudoviricetes sp.]